MNKEDKEVIGASSVARRLSLPDLLKLKTELDKREDIQATAHLAPGKLQIDLLNVRSDVSIKRPLMRLRMGSQHYFSSRSKHVNGNWNEGFLFTISYHNQLFDTIELDLYDKKNKWRPKAKHIGKAKLKIAKLKDRDDIFITFLPMYEYHVRRYLPAHIQLPHTFLKSHMPNMSSRLKEYRHNFHNLTRKNDNTNDKQEDNDSLYLDIPPAYLPHPSHSKHSMTPFIGSIQVRVRYSFQLAPDFESDTLSPFYFDNDNRSTDTFSLRTTNTVTSGSKSAGGSTSRLAVKGNVYGSESVQSSGSSTSSSNTDSCITTTIAKTSSATVTTATTITTTTTNSTTKYRDAVEPKLIIVDDISNILLSTTPSTPKPNNKNSLPTRSESSIDLNFDQTLKKQKQNMINLEQYQVDFPKMDGENKKKNKQEQQEQQSDTASIKSHNFGDKNFAFRWINESFEEVAISHPSLDRMIGMVVSPQTRILLRAVVKMFNAFGQGFKITILQLLSQLSLLQNFYSDIPRPAPAEKITDLQFLDDSYYFLGHAIIAYGWRGISYLGSYAKYLKDVVKAKSNKEAIIRYLKIPQEDLLGYEYGLRKGAVFQPSYFVSYDKGHEAVVIGIRGTWSLYDCITDLVCEYRPWKGGLVHSGILASAQWFFTRIIPQIFLYISEQTASGNRRISSFIITGHSLGAGTAAVLTMMVADHLDQLRELSNNPNFNVHCYSYAPVASVSLDLSEKYKNHIDSFVCNDDLVARLSYGTASCAKELIMDSLIAVDGLGGSTKVNTNSSTRKECFDIIQTRRKEIYHGKEPRYPLLYVPGTVYHFRRGSKVSSKLPTQDMMLPGTTPASTSTSSASHTKQNKPTRPRSLSGSAEKRKSTTIPPLPSFIPTQSEPTLPTAANDKRSSALLAAATINETTFTLHKSSAMLSEEVIISKTCLEDHMVVTYLTAFQMARQECMRQNAFHNKRQQAIATTSRTKSTSSLSSSSTLLQSSASTTTASISPSSTQIKLTAAGNILPFLKVGALEEDKE